MTTTEAKYPQSLSQTTGSGYATWSGFNNIKTSDGNAASYIWGKSAPSQTGQPNRPSKISATNFGFAIPTGAKITNITVEYNHFKVGNTNALNPQIPAPTITLKNLSGLSMKGYAPTSTAGNLRCSFDVSNININDVNNSNFGVEFDYPANTNEDSGGVFLYYIRILITYTPLDYSLTIQGFSDLHIGDPAAFTINMVDKNRNGYDPTVEITLPQWVIFTNANGQGTVTQSGNTLYWKVPFSKVGMGASISLYFLLSNLGNNMYLTAREPITNAGESFRFDVVDDPHSGWIVDIDDTNIVVVNTESGKIEKLYVTENESIQISLLYPENEGLPTQMVHDQKSYSYSLNGGSSWTNKSNPGLTVIQDNEADLRLKYSTLGKRTVTFKSASGGTIFKRYEIHVMPETKGVLSASILSVDSEARALMADGYVYTAQSYLKINSVIQDKEFYDCQYNCRMLVFNGEIPSGTSDAPAYIISHAEYVSAVPSVVGTYQIVSCDFVYHEDYRLFIIFTSDYSELSGNGFELQYTSPAIVEKIVYNGYEEYGNYPYPVNNVLSNSSAAEIKIPLYKSSNSFILSKPPLPEWFGTIENTAVVGIQLDFDIEYADECVLYAKLHAPNGRIGTRSVILNNPTVNNNAGRVSIGGMNDLFGFDVLDIQDFNKWEIELQYNNIFTNTASQALITFKNATITLYTTPVEDQYITMYIDDKDMRYYGLFLEEVEIPEGLKTDTKFLEVDGTDTNEAYRMNIDKKTIKIKFTVDGCDIHETTVALRRISKMLVNERDSLNRPIPRKIAFSHYPDVHWYYVLTDVIDTEVEYGDYTAEAKLIIPSGTANSNEDTVSNNVGVNNSLAKINPIIQIVPTGTEISITEKYSGQKFEISNSSLSRSDLVLIDCINRKVKVKRNGSNDNIQDISSSVMYSSDWFIIHGEYFFETINCMLQTVTFTERW